MEPVIAATVAAYLLFWLAFAVVGFSVTWDRRAQEREQLEEQARALIAEAVGHPARPAFPLDHLTDEDLDWFDAHGAPEIRALARPPKKETA